MNLLQIATAILASISFGLLLAAVTSDYWVEASDHAGLWQVCRGSACYSRGMDVPGYVHATRAFMLIATIAGAVSFFSLWSLFRQSNIGSFSLAKMAAVASLVAGLCALIAMSVYTGLENRSNGQEKYGWSFGAGWTSVPLSLLTGVFAVQMHTGRTM